jgi:hypothetical protein
MFSIPEDSKKVGLETSAERYLNTSMTTQQNDGKFKY